MKLYSYGTAPNPRRVKIFLAEKGIEYELVEVDLMKGAHKSPDFLQKNSRGKLPTLELDDGRYLAESVAICRYLEAICPEPNLFGADPFELGYIEMRNRQLETELWSPLRTSWINGPVLSKMGNYKINAEAKAESDAAVNKYYEVLDREFAEAEYAAGKRFTVADITLLTGIDFARTLVGLRPDENLQNLWRWHALVSARDSVDALD